MPFYFLARQIVIIYYPGIITGASRNKTKCLYLHTGCNYLLKTLCLCSAEYITIWRTRNLWLPNTFHVFVSWIVIVIVTKTRLHFHHCWLGLNYSYRCEIVRLWDCEIVRCERYWIISCCAASLSQLDWLQLYSSSCSMSSSSSSTSGN